MLSPSFTVTVLDGVTSSAVTRDIVQPPQHTVDTQLGPFVVGVYLELFLTGVLTLQTWNYYEIFSTKDRRVYHVLVLALFLLATSQSCTDFASLYKSVVLGYTDFTRFQTLSWLATYSYGCAATIDALAQAFFLAKCYQQTKSFVVLILGGIGGAACLASGWATMALQSHHTGTNMLIPMIIYLAVTAATNTGISAVLALNLEKIKPPTNNMNVIRPIERMQNKITQLTLGTASISAAVSIANLVAYLVSHKFNNAYLTFHYLAGKIFAISVLSTLAARVTYEVDLSEGSESKSGNQRPERENGGVQTTRLRMVGAGISHNDDPIDFPMKVMHRNDDMYLDESDKPRVL